ncbi:hypothetical protein NC651_003943 [Populus alba x Populus x berolinensis]|nr:hypothetical protein NC651_003943 [Populus alba x Populus x berolinensis]
MCFQEHNIPSDQAPHNQQIIDRHNCIYALFKVSALAMTSSHGSISSTITLTSISSKTQFVIAPKTNPFVLDSCCFKLHERSSFSVRAMGSSVSSSQKPDNIQGAPFSAADRLVPNILMDLRPSQRMTIGRWNVDLIDIIILHLWWS